MCFLPFSLIDIQIHVCEHVSVRSPQRHVSFSSHQPWVPRESLCGGSLVLTLPKTMLCLLQNYTRRHDSRRDVIMNCLTHCVLTDFRVNCYRHYVISQAEYFVQEVNIIIACTILWKRHPFFVYSHIQNPEIVFV